MLARHYWKRSNIFLKSEFQNTGVFYKKYTKHSLLSEACAALGVGGLVGSLMTCTTSEW